MLSNSERNVRVKNAKLLRFILSHRVVYMLVIWALGGRGLARNRFPKRRIDFFFDHFFEDIDVKTGQLSKLKWQRLFDSVGMSASGGGQEAFGAGFFRHVLGVVQNDRDKRRFLSDFLYNFLKAELNRELLETEHKVTALTVDITQQCNLQCTHCFADSTPRKHPMIDMEHLLRFLREAVDQGGCRFFAILGGEPLLEVDRLVAVARAFPYMPIVVFTNGTLINDALCARLREVPNVALFVSMEGFRALTDDVRGTDAFDTANAALQCLRRNRMIYGVSVTATKQNYREIVSDAFIQYLNEMEIYFAWIFDLKPIGRAATNQTSTMVLEQAEKDVVNEAVTRINKSAGFLYINTEKDPSVIGGCPAHRGTYFHVACDGHVSPCIAVRYFDEGTNIRDASFDEVISSPAFKRFRDIGEGEGCPGRFYPGELKQWIACNELKYLYLREVDQ